MKKIKWLLLLISLSTFVAYEAYSGYPMPPAVTYGLIRDEYGHPLLHGSSAWLVKADTPTNICAGHTIEGLIRPDVNYRLSLELENEPPLMREYAALVGTPMQIIVKIGEDVQPLTPSPFFNAPAAGTSRRIDFCTGVDSDNDGLPDAWEWLIIAWSEGLYSSLADITPDGDLDNDGMTNLQEFLAGTNPLLATDLLKVTNLERVKDSNRMAITFTTVENRRYRVVTTTLGAENQWIPVPTADSAKAGLSYQTYKGTGRDITLYLDTQQPAAMFRIAVD
jgi:hypothetical protein